MSSSYVVTDSFHGMCFALIFNKQFMAFTNTGRGTTRFESLLGKLGLMERLVDDPAKGLPSVIEKTIDYSCIQKELDVAVEQSKEWLNSRINAILKGSSDE